MSEQTASESTIERIKEIIANDVRPYIEMDGGTIEFVRYDEKIVYVRLAGACNGCPASMLTLKGGVERNIRRRVPEVLGVRLEEMEPEQREDNGIASITL
jgi:Fe-S cluster biogenesis protein NfuA